MDQLDARIAQLQAQLGNSPGPSTEVDPVEVDAHPWMRSAGGDHDLDGRIAQLQAHLANDNPNMSPVEDWGRSAVSGLEQGVTSVLGAPNSLLHLGDQGVRAGAKWLWGQTGAFTPQQLDAIYDPKRSPSPLAMMADHFPTQASIDGTVQHFAGPYHTPQTETGRFIHSVASFAPAALAPEGAIPRMAAVALPGVASEGLGEVGAQADRGQDGSGQGHTWETTGRIAGGLVGGAGAGMVDSVANAPLRTFGNIVQQAGPAGSARAVQIAQGAARLPGGGLAITPMEALTRATGDATGAPELQHFIENSRYGAAPSKQLFATRPQQIRNVAAAFADQIAPPVDPELLGSAAQARAIHALHRLDAGRSAATGPLYTAADAQHVDPGMVADLRDALETHAAGDHTGLIAPGLRQFREALAPNGAPLTDIGSLDTVRKFYRDQIDLPPGSAASLPKQQAAALRPYLEHLDAQMENASPAFQAAKQMHGVITSHVIDPANGGILGKMSQPADPATYEAALFPAQPSELQPGATARAIGRLDAPLPPGAATTAPDIAPSIGAALLRDHLVRALNESMQENIGGPNQRGGAKWISSIAGNQAQGDTLRAAMDAVQPGLHQQFDPLVDAMMATGTRLGVGSRTAMLQEMQRTFGQSPGPVRALSRLIDPLEWGRHLDTAVGGAMYHRQMDDLAGILSTPADEMPRLFRRAAGHSQNNLLATLLLDGTSGSPSHH